MSAYQDISVLRRALLALLISAAVAGGAYAQKKSSAKPSSAKPKASQPQPESEITKLRDLYIKATKEYKASLEKLLALYQASVQKAQARLDQSKKLLADGLISQRDLEQGDRALADAKLKVLGVQQQIA